MHINSSLNSSFFISSWIEFLLFGLVPDWFFAEEVLLIILSFWSSTACTLRLFLLFLSFCFEKIIRYSSRCYMSFNLSNSLNLNNDSIKNVLFCKFYLVITFLISGVVFTKFDKSITSQTDGFSLASLIISFVASTFNVLITPTQSNLSGFTFCLYLKSIISYHQHL